jgi:site-specific recombinase XerD
MYLKTVKHCAQNTATKYLVRLKKVVNLSLANEWIIRDPFIKYQCTYKPTYRGYLNAEELQKIELKEFKIPRLQKVRDIFVFCCYTGFAQADVEALSLSDITTGIDGEKWIIINRKKTDGRSPIPLLPQALAIIEKYKNDPETLAKGKLLPVNSNQRMNGYLKEIADITGITKNLTMHLARHTFATTVTLSNGVPIETVSKMLGHNSIKTTQIYSKVVDTKISNDMKALKAKMTIKKPLQKVM